MLAISSMYFYAYVYVCVYVYIPGQTAPDVSVFEVAGVAGAQERGGPCESENQKYQNV